MLPALIETIAIAMSDPKPFEPNEMRERAVRGLRMSRRAKTRSAARQG